NCYHHRSALHSSPTRRSSDLDHAWQPNLAVRMDRLIARGAPPAILVMPDCFTRYGGSQYLDSSATGSYETHLLEELIPWVDRERSEEHTSELQSLTNLVCRLL